MRLLRVNNPPFNVLLYWSLARPIMHIVNVCEHVGPPFRLQLRFGRVLCGLILQLVAVVLVFAAVDFVVAQEVLLSVAADLRARPRTDVLFNQAPIFTVHLQAL